MTTYKVSAYNEYSTISDNSRLVITIEFDADNETQALDQMEQYTTGWNSAVIDESNKVNMLVCNGFVRAQ